MTTGVSVLAGNPGPGAAHRGRLQVPEPFTVKADDGITDLYGVMQRSTDPSKVSIMRLSSRAADRASPRRSTRAATTSLTRSSASSSSGGTAAGTRSGRMVLQPAAATCATTDWPTRRRRSTARQAAFVRGHQPRRHLGHPAAASCRRRRLSYPTFKIGVVESGNHEDNIYNNSWSEKHHRVKEVEKDGHLRVRHREEFELAANPKGHDALPATSTTTSTRRAPIAWPMR